ncbi:MAG: carbohydrate porin [Pseudomonadota bacterium]|nr:carbohydrate porin [Pseudomonadota bacterium]
MKSLGVAFLAGLSISATANAYDINEQLSVDGVLAAAGQCQEASSTADLDNSCRGAAPFQAQINFRPDEQNALSFKLGFAAGDGLNRASAFALAPWAADLEDDVENINGSGRDYLLTAWYQHRFRFDETNELKVTLGLIDSTDYLDDNVYSNDEYSQFMNQALVNAPNAFLPSYDLGAALEWEWNDWSLRGVYMNAGESHGGNDCDFFAAQLGYRVQSSLGVGNYRLLAGTTSDGFPNRQATHSERRAMLILSFDQELGRGLGGFLRLGWQRDDAAVDYTAIYSGGIDVNGRYWGWTDHNIGLAYAYLEGGNGEIESTRVAEGYYRIAFDEHFALTADVQYMRDNIRYAQSPEGWILGLRGTVRF